MSGRDCYRRKQANIDRGYDSTRQYEDLNSKLSTIPMGGKLGFDLNQYVTDKSLQGLFFLVAVEEKKIRQDPAARTTELLKKVFGSR